MNSENSINNDSIEFRRAFKNSIKTLTDILAPFLLFVILKDLHEAVAYIKNNLITAFIFIVALTTLFLWNIFTQSKLLKANIITFFSKTIIILKGIFYFRFKKLTIFHRINPKKIVSIILLVIKVLLRR